MGVANISSLHSGVAWVYKYGSCRYTDRGGLGGAAPRKSPPQAKNFWTSHPKSSYFVYIFTLKNCLTMIEKRAFMYVFTFSWARFRWLNQAASIYTDWKVKVKITNDPVKLSQGQMSPHLMNGPTFFSCHFLTWQYFFM